MRRISLTEGAAIAEIFSAVAVVVSLLFVGLEVRRNTLAVQAATLQAITNSSREQILTFVTDADVTRISRIGDEDPSKLSPDEAIRYFWTNRSFWLGMQNISRQRE